MRFMLDSSNRRWPSKDQFVGVRDLAQRFGQSVDWASLERLR
ncbi:hypothetical protein [Variovorax sp. OV329]|nr:hypothetical protein [Variovorax sp. OV329]